MTKPNAISLIGPPACGKGTQAEFLQKYFKQNQQYAHHISTGDLIRRRGDTSGKYVDDNYIQSLLEEELQETQANIYLLDGFPRTIGQVEMANSLFEMQNVFYFTNVSMEDIIGRIEKRGRKEEKTPIQRIEDHIEKTAPLREHLEIYLPFPFTTINGKSNVNEVYNEIIGNLK